MQNIFVSKQITKVNSNASFKSETLISFRI